MLMLSKYHIIIIMNIGLIINKSREPVRRDNNLDNSMKILYNLEMK